MGVNNLMNLIKTYAPKAIKYKNISDYKNKTLGIDANLMLYKIVMAIRRGGQDIKKGDVVTTHIHGLLQKIIGLRKYNITPVFVFDSSFPDIKKETLKKRKRVREGYKKKYDDAMIMNLQDEKKKYFYLQSDITDKEIKDVRNLIKIFGYQIIDSKEEADSELAALSKKGVIDGVITDDLDILLFGGKNILKMFSIDKKKQIQEVDLDVLLKELDITQKQLIDIGIITGCDYCTKVKGIGPIKAYKLIKEYKSLDNLKKRKIIGLDFDHRIVRDYFINPPINKQKILKYKKARLDAYRLTKYLESFGYTLDDINKLLKKVDI